MRGLYEHAYSTPVPQSLMTPTASRMGPPSTSVMRPVGTVTIAAALFSMTPKLVRYFAYFPFRRRQHRAIIGDVLYFVWRPWLLEAFLQVVEGVGANGPALAAQDDESYWPIELGDFRLGQGSRNLLR
jgi:hypothetical protein